MAPDIDKEMGIDMAHLMPPTQPRPAPEVKYESGEEQEKRHRWTPFLSGNPFWFARSPRNDPKEEYFRNRRARSFSLATERRPLCESSLGTPPLSHRALPAYSISRGEIATRLSRNFLLTSSSVVRPAKNTFYFLRRESSTRIPPPRANISILASA